MSTVNGFQVGSETLKYNYESLDNYNTPNFSTSSSTAYAVGDYVMYNGKLYKCTTATTGGTWVSGSWTEAVLSDDVGDLSRQLSDVESALNYNIKAIRDTVSFSHDETTTAGSHTFKFPIIIYEGTPFTITNNGENSFTVNLQDASGSETNYPNIPAGGSSEITAPFDVVAMRNYISASDWKFTISFGGVIIDVENQIDAVDKQIGTITTRTSGQDEWIIGTLNLGYITTSKYRIIDTVPFVIVDGMTVFAELDYLIALYDENMQYVRSTSWIARNTATEFSNETGIAYGMIMARVSDSYEFTESDLVTYADCVNINYPVAKLLRSVDVNLQDLEARKRNDFVVAKTNIKYNAIDGKATFGALAHFDNYGLTPSGDFYLNQRYRVSTKEPITINRDITITVKAGYRWGYIPIGDGGTAGTWSGWKTDAFTMPSGSRFIVQIARVTEDTSEWADVNEFVGAVTYNTYAVDSINALQNQRTYVGNMKPTNGYRVGLFATLFSSVSTSAQGFAISDDTAVMLFNGGDICIYDLESKTILGQYNLASASGTNHANSADFSTEMGTVYPLLYVSECQGQHRCFVEDITNSASTLVQTITFANDGTVAYTAEFDWILDTFSNHIMTFGKSNDTYVVKVFAVPSTQIANVTLNDTDKLDEWNVDSIGETIGTYQGHTVYGNTLYLPVSNTERLLAYDKTSHALIGKIVFSESGTNVGEVEDVAIFGNDILVSNVYSQIYKITL